MLESNQSIKHQESTTSCRLRANQKRGVDVGVLYKTVKNTQAIQKQSMISDLMARGITETQDGKSILDLDYYELRHELVLAEIRKTDIESPENKWF